MPRTDPRRPLFAIIAVLLLAAVAAAGYAGRLRWQNAMLRADYARVQQQLSAARSAPPPAPAPAAAPLERVLSESQRRAMVDKLKSEAGPQKDVWFTHASSNREAEAYQKAIQSAFEEAGWNVRRSSVSDFSLRPGVFFLMADSSPPAYVSTALGAFQAAEITLSSGRDYRAFNERKKSEDPNWRGFEMDADQAYIVAIGPRPVE